MARFQSQEPHGVAVEELERLVRTALFKSGNELVADLLQAAADRIDATYQPKPGQKRKGRASLNVRGIFGSFEIRRDYYYHAGKKQGHYPADAALGLEGSHTPALARLVCLEGADESSYQKAEEHLRETGGIELPARRIERVIQQVGTQAQKWQGRQARPTECSNQPLPVLYVSADATGVPMRRQELMESTGQQADGSAKTRMSYLGCVFTQHTCDQEGHPVRDYQSTSYVSGFASIDVFGPMLRQEAIRRGLGTAHEVVLLIDGANGLANMGRDCFASATQIVDFYHAMEHAGEVLNALLGSRDHPDYQRRLNRWAKQLLSDQVERLIAQTRREATGTSRAEAVEKALAYFVNNAPRMQYGTFRHRGFFIGSGVVEAGCKSIIGTRCKQSGMFWSQTGAESILALRCIHASGRLDRFWKERLNDHAAKNDCLSFAT